jgi:hypothetical protein
MADRHSNVNCSGPAERCGNERSCGQECPRSDLGALAGLRTIRLPFLHADARRLGLLCLLVGVPQALCTAASTNLVDPEPHTAPVSSESDSAYAQSLEKRVADLLSVLSLKDANQRARTHDLLVARYRALKNWHDANDTRLKSASEQESRQIKASLNTLHERFVAALSSELTQEQVELIKDKMTYGTVQVTYDAYCEIVPNLTSAQKQRILELLKEGREEAMDGGSHNEKAAIFKKYKGKINNYLDSQGHDVKQAYKDWGARQKDKATPAAPKPEH